MGLNRRLSKRPDVAPARSYRVFRCFFFNSNRPPSPSGVVCGVCRRSVCVSLFSTQKQCRNADFCRPVLSLFFWQKKNKTKQTKKQNGPLPRPVNPTFDSNEETRKIVRNICVPVKERRRRRRSRCCFFADTVFQRNDMLTMESELKMAPVHGGHLGVHGLIGVGQHGVGLGSPQSLMSGGVSAHALSPPMTPLNAGG